MPYIEFIWDCDDDPNGNVLHIAEHGLTKGDVEEVVCNPSTTGISKSSGQPVAFGMTSWGAYIVVVYELVGEGVVYPITAFELEKE